MISKVPLPDAAGYLVVQRKRGMRWVFRLDHRWRWVQGLGNVAQYVGQHDSDSEAEYFVRSTSKALACMSILTPEKTSSCKHTLASTESDCLYAFITSTSYAEVAAGAPGPGRVSFRGAGLELVYC